MLKHRVLLPLQLTQESHVLTQVQVPNRFFNQLLRYVHNGALPAVQALHPEVLPVPHLDRSGLTGVQTVQTLLKPSIMQPAIQTHVAFACHHENANHLQLLGNGLQSPLAIESPTQMQLQQQETHSLERHEDHFIIHPPLRVPSLEGA
jgi:phospholipase C